VACKRAAPEIDGYGEFHVGKSTVADGAACRPMGELTYCSNNASPPIAGQRTATDLYFRGHEDSSPLVEILVTVSACKADAVLADLRKKLGDPDEEAQGKFVWRKKGVVIVSQIEVEAGLCELNFLRADEKQRLEEILSPEKKDEDEGAAAPADGDDAAEAAGGDAGAAGEVTGGDAGGAK